MSVFPKYVKLGDTALRHMGEDKYFRDAGNWQVRAMWVDGKLLAHSSHYVLKHANGARMEEITHAEWAEDNRGYINEENFKDVAKCKCESMAQSVLGDGCDVCNPEMAEELKSPLWESPDGKYTIRKTDDGVLWADRYGEPWRNLVGDKLIESLLSTIEELENG